MAEAAVSDHHRDAENHALSNVVDRTNSNDDDGKMATSNSSYDDVLGATEE